MILVEMQKLNCIFLTNVNNKIWFKKVTGVDTSRFAKKINLADSKSNTYKLDVSLKKLSDAVYNDVVKKVLLTRLNPKVDVLENKVSRTFKLIYKNQYDTDKQNLEKKRLKMLIKNTWYQWFS